MTGLKPSFALRLKWHFRENRVLYLGLILSSLCLLFFEGSRRPSFRGGWLWDIDPDLYRFVIRGLFSLIAILCFTIIARTVYGAFKGTDPMDAATKKTLLAPTPRYSTSDPKSVGDRPNE